MSDIFLKCPARCNATVSHSSKKGAHLGQHLIRHQRVLCTWSGAGKNVHLAHLNLTWGRCTWRVGATTYHYHYTRFPDRTLDEGQLQAPGSFIVGFLMWVVTDVYLNSYLGAGLLGDLMALKTKEVNSGFKCFGQSYLSLPRLFLTLSCRHMVALAVRHLDQNC